VSKFTLVGSSTAISVTGNSGSGTVTLSAIGNVLIVGTSNNGTGPFLTCTGCSGGMVQMAATATDTILWMGVITATGAQTLSGGATGTYQGMVAQEVSFIGSTLPALDVDNSATVGLGASGNFPSVTPTFTDDIIFCLNTTASGAPFSTTTSGYSYTPTATGDFGGNIYMAMNPDIPIGVAQTPNWIAGSGVGNGGTLLSVALWVPGGMQVIGII